MIVEPVVVHRCQVALQLLDRWKELIEHLTQILNRALLIDHAEGRRRRGSQSTARQFQRDENLLLGRALVLHFLTSRNVQECFVEND